MSNSTQAHATATVAANNTTAPSSHKHTSLPSSNHASPSFSSHSGGDGLPNPPPLARAATYLVADPESNDSQLTEFTSEEAAASVRGADRGASLSPRDNTVYPAPPIYGGSRKGAKTYQEDSYFHLSSANNKITIGGIMDGHGGFNGMIASQCARDTAVAFFHQHRYDCESWSVDQWVTVMQQLFADMHQAIRDKFMAATAHNSNNNNSGHATSPSHAQQQQQSAGEVRHVDDRGIVRTQTGDPVHGGSTCTIVAVIQHAATPQQQANGQQTATIITANVGDSTSLLLPILQQDTTATATEAATATATASAEADASVPVHDHYDFLSTDHGPENSDEYLRIAAMNISTRLLLVYDKTSVMRKYECPVVFETDGSREQSHVMNPWGHGLHPTNVRYEPAVYAVTPRSVSKDSTCIAMTRALGDFYAHQFGLTAVPDVNVKTVQLTSSSNGSAATAAAGAAAAAPACLSFTFIVASDGIWDCWKYEEFAAFVSEQLQQKQLSVAAAGDIILDESITRAVHNFGAKHYDDAALVMWQMP